MSKSRLEKMAKESAKRARLAESGMKPEQYILDEWDKMCDDAHDSLLTDCSLIEDEVLVEMRAYLNAIESRNKDMLQELIECSYDLQCSCGHPACKQCQRYKQLMEFIEKMKDE